MCGPPSFAPGPRNSRAGGINARTVLSPFLPVLASLVLVSPSFLKRKKLIVCFWSWPARFRRMLAAFLRFQVGSWKGVCPRNPNRFSCRSPRLPAVPVGRLPQLTALTSGTTELCDPEGGVLQTELHRRRCPPAQLRREVPLLRACTSLPIEPCTWPSETDRRATTLQFDAKG